MPPAPIITVKLNETRYKELCERLALTDPPDVRIRPTRSPDGQTMVKGQWVALGNTILVNYGFASDSYEKLRFLQSDLVNTLLHEVRHAWQWQTWGRDWWYEDDKLPYALQHKEKDANEFASSHSAAWRGLLVVKRSQPGSNFSKLARHTRGQMV